MGQFSWLDCKTGEQIIDGKPRKSYVLVPEQFGGGHIEESCYEGYGVFGGHDVYDLVADWNSQYLDEVLENADAWQSGFVKSETENLKRLAKGGELSCEKRWLGIVLACYDNDNAKLRFPIKITHDPKAVYEWCPPSKSDPNQGWPADEEDDYWDEEDDW